jgi:glycosyltransferase involved in cell wall biosynthesis
MAEQPLVSIIITSYTMDRLADVCELLDSIRAQTYDNTETIFVAERSRELEQKVRIHALESRLHHVKVVFNDGEPGASAARNLGIQQANGEIIAFVDDDAVLFPDWADEMVKTYADDSVIAVTGLSYPLWEGLPADWLPEEFYWIISCTGWSRWQKITEVRNIWLQNASFRREAFKSAGLIDLGLGPRDAVQGFKGREFKEGIISEEIELSLRIKRATGKRIVGNPAVRIKHRVNGSRLKLGYITRWAYWTGYSKHKTKQYLAGADDHLLWQEHELLNRILVRLLPEISLAFFRNPVLACRRLGVTALALSFVALGYFSYFFSSTEAHSKILFEQKGVEQ